MSSETIERHVGPAIVLVVVALVYARVVGFEAIPVWDDDAYLVSREAVKNWWGVSWETRIWTRELGYPLPVPTFLYAHVRMLFPEAYPHALHALDIGLHLTNCLLVWRLSRSWLDGRYALAVMAIWGVHPVNVEAVAWLTNLKTVAGAACVLGAMTVWQTRVLERPEGTRAGPGTLAAVGGLVFLGLGCRPDTIVSLAGIAILTLRKGGWGEVRRHLFVLLGMLAVALLFVAGGVEGRNEFIARGADPGNTIRERIVRIAECFELSLEHLVWPFDLHPGYFLSEAKPWIDALPGLVLFAVVLGVGLWTVRNRWWRVAGAIGLFVLFYAPFSNVVYLPRLTADTYMYLPSFGFVLALAAGFRTWVGSEMAEEQVDPARIRRLAVVASAVVVVGFAATSFVQTGRWRNAETLWAPVVEAYPGSRRPYTMVGLANVRQGDWRTSRELVDRAMPLYRASRKYPFFVPLVYEETGAPQKAVDVAREMIDRGEDLVAKHYKVFADVLARQEASPPRNDAQRDAFRRALKLYGERERWISRRKDRLHMADYLTKIERFDDAKPFIRREFAAEEAHCFAWVALQRLPVEMQEDLDAPERPGRCRP